MVVPFSYEYSINPEVPKTEEVNKALAVEAQSPNWMMSSTQDRGVPSEDLKLVSSVVCNACTLVSLWNSKTIYLRFFPLGF